MKHWIIAGTLLWAVACTSRPEPPPAPSEVGEDSVVSVEDAALYFALEVKRQGRTVARPKLLGIDGRTVRAERRPPGAPQPDYRVVLLARSEDDHYRVALQLALPGAEGRAEVALSHGEVRTLELGSRPGELQVSVTLMRVDSPEFRALMRLSEEDARRASERSI